MSNIDLEKDDLATQEMLAMLGETDDSATGIPAEDLDMDDLLSSIEAVENQTEMEESELVADSLMDTDLTEVSEEVDPMSELDELAELTADSDLELPSDMDLATDMEAALENDSEDELLDTDALSMQDSLADDSMDILDGLAEPTSIDNEEFDSELDEGLHDNLLSTQTADSTEMDELAIQELAIEEPNDDSIDDAIEDSMEALEEQALDTDLGSDTDFGEQEQEEIAEDTLAEDVLDNLDDSDPLMSSSSAQESMAELATAADDDLINDDEAATPLQTDFSTTESDVDASAANRATEQLQNALSQMLEAIKMNETMQEFAAQVEATTLKATKLAMATAQKAQSEAMRTQETLEANFAAAQSAFDTALDSGYQLQSEELEKFSEVSSSELDAFLSEIHARNQSLNEANQKLAERLAMIKNS